MKKSSFGSLSPFLFVFLMTLGSLTKATNTAAQNASARMPNIVVLFVDDLGYYNMGHRNKEYSTPNIDELAKASLTFTNAYVPSPTCSPSRAALYTGKHPARLKFFRHIYNESGNQEFSLLKEDPAQLPSRNWLPLEETLYSEVLKKNGYNTLLVGKWHLGGGKYAPTNQGFDKAYTDPDAGHPKGYYPPYFTKNPINEQIPKDKYLTDFFTDKAVNYLKSYKDNKPFLLQYSYFNVHT
ncbi:MAG: sulfatase-like hydrolase/transferase, partial [Segetibacter sp.]